MEVFDIFLLEAVLNGILLGGLLALLSLGLNLVFGVIDVVWICYAEMIMIGMYAVWVLHVQYQWPLLAAMACGVALVALLGALLHRFIIRPVLDTTETISGGINNNIQKSLDEANKAFELSNVPVQTQQSITTTIKNVPTNKLPRLTACINRNPSSIQHIERCASRLSR